MTEQPPEYTPPFWVEPKAQAAIDVLLDTLKMPECSQCGAIVERHPDGTPVAATCYPCGVPGQKRANWYVGPAVRPRAPYFAQEARQSPSGTETNLSPMSAEMWQQQAERCAADLATLNARGVRWRGLLLACLPHVPAPLRAHLERELGGQ